MITEAQGLPLAFEVTAANVAEVTLGLDVVDRVRVPRPKGRPRKRPRASTAQSFVANCGVGGSGLPYHAESGLDASVNRVVPRKCMRPASAVGRSSGPMAGWPTIVDWWCDMTGTPTVTLPSSPSRAS